MSSIHDTEATVTVGLTIRMPRAEVAAFCARLTGNDDDIILAAETAMRRELEDDHGVATSELEVDTYLPRLALERELREEVEAERRCEAIYGPARGNADQGDERLVEQAMADEGVPVEDRPARARELHAELRRANLPS